MEAEVQAGFKCGRAARAVRVDNCLTRPGGF